MQRQSLQQSTTAFAPARALLQSTLRRTALHVKKAFEEGSSTDAACSSDDSAFLCGFESVHVFAKNKAVLRHYYY